MSSRCIVLWRLTSRLEDLASAFGAIRQRQGYDLIVAGKFDLPSARISLRHTLQTLPQPRTLSRMTNGPLMPPMVLYRSRGVTEIMRGSKTSGMVGDGERSARYVSLGVGSGAVGLAARCDGVGVQGRGGTKLQPASLALPWLYDGTARNGR